MSGLMSQPREKFATQVNSEILSAVRGLAEKEGRQLQALVDEALKGARFASLQSRSYDGIVIEPLYARAKDASPIATGRASGEPWSVMQRVDLPDPAAANKQILDDLNNGANSLALVFEGDVGDYGYALPATEAAVK